MNILVLSDSHRDIKSVNRLLEIYAKQISVAAHLGDHAQDLLRFQNAYPKLRMLAVAGNCDGVSAAPDECLFRVNGRAILLTHGHKQQVKSNTLRLEYFAMENEADACLFGHTHCPASFDAGRVMFLNPGSIGYPRPGGFASYALVSVSDEGVIRGTILQYNES